MRWFFAFALLAVSVAVSAFVLIEHDAVLSVGEVGLNARAWIALAACVTAVGLAIGAARRASHGS